MNNVLINAKIIERVTRAANYDILAIAVADYLKSMFPRYRIYHPNKESFVIICPKNDKRKIFLLIGNISLRFKQGWEIYDTAFKLDAMIFPVRVPQDVDNYEDIAYIADCIITKDITKQSKYFFTCFKKEKLCYSK